MCESRRHNKNGIHPVDVNGWCDIGVDDTKGATQNRRRIAEGYALDYWLWLENKLRGTPHSARLPKDIPLGELPEVSKQRPRERKEEE